MNPKEKADLRRVKIAAGLTPAQADAVIESQEAWDAHPDNPANAKPEKEPKPSKVPKADKTPLDEKSQPPGNPDPSETPPA